MRRVRVGEINRNRVFEAATVKIADETRACVDLKRNPVAIAVFIASFSDVP
jgi:hypothetical protein